MALPYVFANVTELDTPQLDSNFSALGALTVIPCVASGTNSITLTPAANTPTVAVYTSNAPEFSFEAASTSSGALTLQVLGLGLKNVYKNNGATAAGANDFIAGSTYKVSYNAALNGAAGGWVILNQGASSASAGSVQGAYKKLKVQATSDTGITITADQIACSDGSTAFTTVFAASVTIATGTVGANGIDTGSISSSTWYYSYVIYNTNTSTAASLLSLSSTAPTLPAGYSQFARVGAHITDGSAHLLRTLQFGRKAQYVIGTNPTTLPVMSNSSAGNAVSGPTFVSVSVAAFVPPTASEIDAVLNAVANAYASVAPNASYGVITSTTNPPPLGNSASVQYNQTSRLITLETTALSYASSNASNGLFCAGWTDNL